jgi:hypothetical protein
MRESPRSFLDVERSVSGRGWVDRLDAGTSRVAAAISQRSNVSEILARILAGRGVGIEEAERFLNPTLRDLMPDPSSLTDMDALVERLARAIENRERIALFGDYDVDGACACALVVRYLRHFGIEPEVYIPDRLFEGYGPNTPAIERLIVGGARLIVTLDCGTSSIAPIAHARERGVDVLVVDHHLADHALPPANAVVNPNRPDDVSGLGYLCGAGVAFMVLVGLNRVLRQRGVGQLPDLMGLIDLAALATVCDVVPLRGLNRAFVVRGLELMRRGGNPGIAALALAGSAGRSAPVTSLSSSARGSMPAGGSATPRWARVCCRSTTRTTRTSSPHAWRSSIPSASGSSSRRWRKPSLRRKPRSAGARGRRFWCSPRVTGTPAWWGSSPDGCGSASSGRPSPSPSGRMAAAAARAARSPVSISAGR